MQRIPFPRRTMEAIGKMWQILPVPYSLLFTPPSPIPPGGIIFPKILQINSASRSAECLTVDLPIHFWRRSIGKKALSRTMPAVPILRGACAPRPGIRAFGSDAPKMGSWVSLKGTGFNPYRTSAISL